MLIFFSFLFLFELIFATQSISVIPHIKDINLNRSHTVEYYVSNTGNNTIRVKVEARYSSIEKMKKIKPIKNRLNDDLSKYIKISPKVISIKAKSGRKVRVRVVKPKEISSGEYRTYISFRIIESKNKKISLRKVKKGDVATQVSMNIITNVSIYGNVGNERPVLDVTCNKISNSLKIFNLGLKKFRGILKIYKEKSNKVLQKENILLLRETYLFFKPNFKFIKNYNYMIKLFDRKTKKLFFSKICKL